MSRVKISNCPEEWVLWRRMTTDDGEESVYFTIFVSLIDPSRRASTEDSDSIPSGMWIGSYVYSQKVNAGWVNCFNYAEKSPYWSMKKARSMWNGMVTTKKPEFRQWEPVVLTDDLVERFEIPQVDVVAQVARNASRLDGDDSFCDDFSTGWAKPGDPVCEDDGSKERVLNFARKFGRWKDKWQIEKKNRNRYHKKNHSYAEEHGEEE